MYNFAYKKSNFTKCLWDLPGEGGFAGRVYQTGRESAKPTPSASGAGTFLSNDGKKRSIGHRKPREFGFTLLSHQSQTKSSEGVEDTLVPPRPPNSIQTIPRLQQTPIRQRSVAGEATRACPHPRTCTGYRSPCLVGLLETQPRPDAKAGGWELSWRLPSSSPSSLPQAPWAAHWSGQTLPEGKQRFSQRRRPQLGLKATCPIKGAAVTTGPFMAALSGESHGSFAVLKVSLCCRLAVHEALHLGAGSETLQGGSRQPGPGERPELLPWDGVPAPEPAEPAHAPRFDVTGPRLLQPLPAHDRAGSGGSLGSRSAGGALQALPPPASSGAVHFSFGFPQATEELSRVCLSLLPLGRLAMTGVY